MSVSASPSDVRFVGVSLDCADPAELAEFYLQMLVGACCGVARPALGCRYQDCCSSRSEWRTTVRRSGRALRSFTLT